MANVPLLDLTPGVVDIKFQCGSTFFPIFFYLAPDYSVINISAYTAKMSARESAASEAALDGWDLTTENDGLAIVQGNATLEDGTVVTGAWGVQANVPADVTAAVTWASAVYDCDLLNGTVNIPLVKGKLFATAEITP